jgi:hypothetical protein
MKNYSVNFATSKRSDQFNKMKVIFAIFAIIAVVAANPVQISDNNVGDVVSVLANLNANLTNKVDQNIVAVLVALLNQQGIVIGVPDLPGGQQPPSPLPAAGQDSFQITPEMIQQFQSLLAKH